MDVLFDLLRHWSWRYALSWPFYYVRASTRNPEGILTKPAQHSFVQQEPASYFRQFRQQIPTTLLISLANNHMGDRGQEGLDSSIRVITAEEGQRPYATYPLGRKTQASPIFVHQTHGLRVGILTWTEYFNRTVHFNSGDGIYQHTDLFDHNQDRFDWVQLKQELALDSLIAYPHWGQEFHHFATAADRQQAQQLLGQGIDLLAGAHTHILQGMDWFDQKICAYGLGHFCGLTASAYTRLGGLLALHISLAEANRGQMIGYTLYPVVLVSKTNQLMLLTDLVEPHSLAKKLRQRFQLMYH